MTGSIDQIRRSFAAREENLRVFETFSGTATPGEGGAPELPEPGGPDSGMTVSDTLAIGTFASLGLTGVSYGLKRYSAGFLTKDPANPLTAMKLIYDRMQVAKALEAVQEGKSSSKLMELLPYVGAPVQRMNITKLWSEVEDSLDRMKIYTDKFAAGYQQWEGNWEKINTASSAAFVGFGAVSALGAIATTATAVFHDRAMPLLDDLAEDTASLDGAAALRVDAAAAEFEARASFSMQKLDAKVVEIKHLADNLPDFDGVVDLLADAEALFDPIKALTTRIGTLIDPYEGFLDVADVIAAPISGVLDLFENPPKVLPTIVGYETITPGFWLTVPDPTWSNPFQTKRVWVPPVRVPIPGFKELFSPIPRDEVQKIIDLITKIAGLPQELLAKALSPILQPIEDAIDKVLRPILDKLNPFTEYLGDFNRIADTIDALLEKLGAGLAEIETSVAAITQIVPEFDPIAEIGRIDPAGMPTYFGDDTDEWISGALPDVSGGFLSGAVLYGNGGADTLIGTQADDFLSGGDGDDVVNGGDGADIILGGAGDDLLYGDGGDDLIIGGSGNDTLVGGSGNNTLRGGEGFDVVDYGASSAGVVVDLIRGNARNGHGGIDTLAEIETVIGSAFADVLIGGDGAFRLAAGAGDDLVLALGGDNLVDLTGGGNNRVLLGSGADTVLGGTGDDVVLAGRGGGNVLDLSAGGNNRVNAGDGADTIIGGAGRDVIRPGRGDDLVDLRAGGDNFVFNLRGDATIQGGAGDDVIFGGIGDTRILAGGGNNRIVAGPGRDTIGFVQEAHETRLLDFRPGSDTLDFTGHDGVSGLDDLTLRQIGTSTIIDDGAGGRIVLAGLGRDQIGDGDFLF